MSSIVIDSTRLEEHTTILQNQNNQHCIGYR